MTTSEQWAPLPAGPRRALIVAATAKPFFARMRDAFNLPPV